MRTSTRYTLLLSAIAMGLLLQGVTQTAAAQDGKRPPKIDPRALGVLKQMSDTLAGAKAFSYRSTTMVQVPSATGQLVTLFSEAKVAVKRPGMLRAELRGEAPNFDFFYDGSTVTAYAPEQNTFSTVAAPPTVDAMLSGLEAETGIRFAVAPLLFSDPYKVLTERLTHAAVIGQAVVNGTVCDHLAMRSEGVDWEVWVSRGSQPLPQRLAATFGSKSRISSALVNFSHWNLRPWLWDSSFVFRKPSGAKEIPFRPMLKRQSR